MTNGFVGLLRGRPRITAEPFIHPRADEVWGTRTYMAGMSDLVVWFDGSCPLCRREIAWMRRLDRAGAICFVDAADDRSTCPLDRADLLARFHAREDGVLLSGAAAFAAMWRAIPLLRPLGLVARSRPILALLERGYRQFLRLRPRLQRMANGNSTSDRVQ